MVNIVDKILADRAKEISGLVAEDEVIAEAMREEQEEMVQVLTNEDLAEDQRLNTYFGMAYENNAVRPTTEQIQPHREAVQGLMKFLLRNEDVIKFTRLYQDLGVALEGDQSEAENPTVIRSLKDLAGINNWGVYGLLKEGAGVGENKELDKLVEGKQTKYLFDAAKYWPAEGEMPQEGVELVWAYQQSVAATGSRLSEDRLQTIDSLKHTKFKAHLSPIDQVQAAPQEAPYAVLDPVPVTGEGAVAPSDQEVAPPAAPPQALVSGKGEQNGGGGQGPPPS